MPKVIRTKIKPQRNLPVVWQTLILAISLVLLEFVIVMTMSPKNIFALIIFFANLEAIIICFLHSVKVSYKISILVSTCVVTIAVLKAFDMLNILNIVLVAGIGICFITFAKDRDA